MTNANFEFRDNSGQIVVGSDNNLQFFKYEITPHGGVVNILPPEQIPRVTARKTPIRLRPRLSSDLIERTTEIEQSVTALKASQTVELYGSAGIGKSVLLRQLAHHEIAESLQHFPDGVIYFHQHREEPVEDLQQKLFEAFFDSDRPFKPSAVRVRHDLQNKRALILLDNIKLSRKDIEKLGEIAPNCVFAFTSSDRSLWGEGQPIQIAGLSSDAALALVERELQRSLTAQEQAAVVTICTSLNGHPLEILQQLVGVRENKECLTDVASRVQKNTSHKARIEQLLQPLTTQQRSVLLALAALGGIALTANQVSAIADVQDVKTDLNDLEKMHLVQQEDSRYSLSTNLLDSVKQIENLAPYMERAVSSFTKWAQHATPEELKQKSEAVSHLLQWSVEQGRWNDVLMLGKPFESALALSGQWEIQDQVLQWYQQAAESLGNKTAIAWASHAMGVRSFCLGETFRAQNLLNKALELREGLGDLRGVELTQQHLNSQIPTIAASIPTNPVMPSPFWTDLFQKALVPIWVTGGLIGAGVFVPKIISSNFQTPIPTPTKTLSLSNSSPTPTPSEVITSEQPSPSTSQMTAEDFLQRGLDKYSKGDVSGAIKDYNQAINLKNDYAEAHYQRGLAYSKLGITQKAIEDFDKALELKDDYIDAYMDRGILRTTELDNAKGAIDDFSRIIALKPTNVEAYTYRGTAYVHLKEFQNAIDEFNHAIEIDSNFADAYMYRGLLIMAKVDKQRGVKDLQRAADLMQEQGRTKEAQAILETIRENPSNH